MKISAAIAREANGQFLVEPIELREPGFDEILVQLVGTGICHTDLAVLDRLIPLPLPMVLGHEGAGYVARVGSGVTGFAPGDPVVLTFDSCGRCDSCHQHHPSYCDRYPLLNLSTRRPDGSTTITDSSGNALGSSFFGQSSFATWAISSPRNTIKVRRDAPIELLGPLGCGFSTGAGAVFNVIRPEVNATLAVIGTGAVGMAALMAAKVAGVQRIIAIDRVLSRLDLARELGATDTIDTTHQSLNMALAEVGGIDHAIDTSGVPSLIAATVGEMKGHGTCVVLGASKDMELKLHMLPLIRGAVVRGALHGDCDPAILIPQLVDLFMEGRFPIDRLSAFYDLASVNQGVSDSLSGKTIKPILRMSNATSP